MLDSLGEHTSVVVIIAAILGAVYAYTRFVDRDQNTADKMFVRMFVTSAVVLTFYAVWQSWGSDEPFPFDTDAKDLGLNPTT